MRKRPINYTYTQLERERACRIAVEDACVCGLPKTWLGDNAKQIDLVLKRVFEQWPKLNNPRRHPIEFAANQPTNGITSYKMWEWLVNSTDPDIEPIAKSLKEDQVRVMPLSWLGVDDMERFLAKSLSRYAGINSPQHKAFLEKIGFTSDNCENWVSFILEERSFATIHSFQRNKNGFTVTYEIPIPLTNKYDKAHQ